MNQRHYMTRDDELAKQPDALPMFERIAAASVAHAPGDVFNALWSFWNFAHALDDLIDETGLNLEEKETALKVVFDFVGNLLANPDDVSHGLPMGILWRELAGKAQWPEDRRELADAALDSFTNNLVGNPFYTRHAEAHRAMFDMMIARTLDAEWIERTRPVLQALLPAVRCADVDFIVHCARLAGGWTLMREVGRLRDYDVNP